MNFRREIFLIVFSAENLEYICLALRERASLIRIYNGTGYNSFIYLQHNMRLMLIQSIIIIYIIIIIQFWNHILTPSKVLVIGEQMMASNI